VAQRHRRPPPRRDRRRRLPAVRRPAAARLGSRRSSTRSSRAASPARPGPTAGATRLGPPAAWDDPVVPPGDGGQQLYGGDLDGVVEHLDHLAALGVNALYLTPFFPGASNHRYNAASFEEVDPLLGGDKALARLSQEVHARGWHLLGDLTTNHCGDTHAWFRRALEDAGSPEREFFYFPGPQDNTYESWLGHSSLPKFRFSSAELRRRLLAGPGSIAGRWLRPPFDLDGWRVDVANMTGRHATDDFNAEVARPCGRPWTGAAGHAAGHAHGCHRRYR
jgi:alpha-glucosidase